MKKVKTHFNNVLMLIAFIGVAYLLFSFFNWDLRIAAWNGLSRVIYGVFLLWITIFAVRNWND